MPRKTHSGWALAAIVSTALAVSFILSGILSGCSLNTCAFLGIGGATLGAIAAPEIEPEAFRHPALWQTGFAVAGSLMVAMAVEASATGYGLAVLLGCIAGYLAPYWIRHIELP